MTTLLMDAALGVISITALSYLTNNPSFMEIKHEIVKHHH